MSGAAASIKPHKPSKVVLHKNGKTKDIVKVTLDVERTDRDDTEEFAKNFEPSQAGLAKLYRWVKHNIRYQMDPAGKQWIQTPSYLNYSSVGDCKSMTVFICSVLHHLGLDYIIRFTAYTKKSKKLTHVYPIAILPNGQKIPMDVVFSVIKNGPHYLPDYKDRFGREKKFYHKIDFYKSSKMTEISKLGNLPGESQAIQNIAHLMSDVSDSIILQGIGDVTQMTAGQFDRYIMADRMKALAANAQDTNTATQYREAAKAISAGSIAGIGSLSPGMSRDVDKFLRISAAKRQAAFKMPAEMARHAIGGIGKFLNKIFKKFINWLVKGPIKFMSPYFLFLFLKKKTTAKIEARRKKQLKTFGWIQRSTGMTKNQLLGLTYNGILKQTGKSPAQILNSSGHQIAGAALAALIPKILKFVKGAIGFLIKVVKKIVSLFKKKEVDAGEIGEGAMSDITLLEELPEDTKPGGSTTTTNPENPDSTNTNGGGRGPSKYPSKTENNGGNNTEDKGGNSALLAAGAAAVAYFAFA